MFAKDSDTKSGLQKAIDELFSEMSSVDGNSEEYANMVTQLDVLYKLKEVDSKRKISPDTLAIVFGNLAGILLIVAHERTHIITTKARDFILRLR